MVDWKNPEDPIVKLAETGVALAIGSAFVLSLSTGEKLLIQEDNLQDRSNSYLLDKFNAEKEAPTLMDVANLEKEKSHIKMVGDKVFSLKDVFQNTDGFTDSLVVTVAVNNEIEASRLTLRNDGEPSLLEVNSSHSAENNGAEADQLIDTARRHIKTLRANGISEDKGLGVYEVKDGSVIFQAKEQPDTAQVMSIARQTTPQTSGPG